MQLNALAQLLRNRSADSDKPQFYDAWNPNADPGMELAPLQGHPAFNDKNAFMPDDVMSYRSGRDTLSRLLGLTL